MSTATHSFQPVYLYTVFPCVLAYKHREFSPTRLGYGGRVHDETSIVVAGSDGVRRRRNMVARQTTAARNGVLSAMTRRGARPRTGTEEHSATLGNVPR